MEEKNYTIGDFREGLGLNANVAHPIKVVGKKAAMFTERVKKAISDNYKKAVNSIREKAAAMKKAVVDKASEVKTGVVNATTHAMNNIDMRAYHLAQEDYQKIMNKKTAKLDSKIAKISTNMKAIENAEIGFRRNQVISEKERAYLLHRSEDLLKKYQKERNTIASETMQIASFEKGQNEKLKIAGKRRILIGALDLKKIVTNAKGAIVNKSKQIAQAASNTMSKMKEKMQERKALKEEKKRQEQEAALLAEEEKARRIAEEEAMKLQEELSSKSIDELFNELTDGEVERVSEIAQLESDKTFINMNAFGEIMKINEKLDELKEVDPKSYYIANQIVSKNPVQKEINELGDNLVKDTDKLIKENPEEGLSLIKASNEKEVNDKAKNEEKVNAEKQKSYEEGLKAGREETAKEVAELKALVESLQKQVASITTPVKEEPASIDYNSMKKDELLEEARKAGLDVKPSMKKADIIDSLSKTELQDLKEQVETTKKK